VRLDLWVEWGRLERLEELDLPVHLVVERPPETPELSEQLDSLELVEWMDFPDLPEILVPLARMALWEPLVHLDLPELLDLVAELDCRELPAHWDPRDCRVGPGRQEELELPDLRELVVDKDLPDLLDLLGLLELLE